MEARVLRVMVVGGGGGGVRGGIPLCGLNLQNEINGRLRHRSLATWILLFLLPLSSLVRLVSLPPAAIVQNWEESVDGGNLVRG